MKTIIEFITDTPSDTRGQSKSVAAMHPAMEAFEKAMADLGHPGEMTIRHVRAKAPATTKAPEITETPDYEADPTLMAPLKSLGQRAAP